MWATSASLASVSYTHLDVYKRQGLVDPRILAMASPAAQLISVAKRRSRHSMPQEDINALLVREALAGREVLRLKGGDPFLFGRGGEEAEACICLLYTSRCV